MRFLFPFTLLLLSLSLHARAAAPMSAPEGMIVQQVDPNFSVEHFKDKGVTVYGAENLQDKRASKSKLPSSKEMSAWLKQSDLAYATSKWDAVEYSTFYVRALKLDFAELKSRYPTLPKKGLSTFQQIVRKDEE
ncbi:hypothetical protein WDW86_02785 [Bdellovibrionota bacterium FG-2]